MSKKMEEKKELGFDIGDTSIDMKATPIIPAEEKKVVEVERPATPRVNILRNERVIVRHIPKETGMVTNPKHVLYGGMAEGA